MKILSIRNPLSYLVCAGIKGVENRNWQTDYRGRILIHSSGTTYYSLSNDDFPPTIIDAWTNGKKTKEIKKIEKWLEQIADFYGYKSMQELEEYWSGPAEKIRERKPFFLAQAIIGEVTIAEIKRGYQSPWSTEEKYQWILTDAVLYEYDKILRPVIGKLGLTEREGG